MKNYILAGLATFVLAFSSSHSHAALYYGPTYATTGQGPVNGASLSLTDNGTTVYGTFKRGSGAFDNNVVFFIDSVSGGFASTTDLYDNSTGWTRSISGLISDGSARSTQSFAPGFAADYAFAFNFDAQGYLYHLAGGPGSTFGPGISINVATANGVDYTFRFKWTDIGQVAGSDNGFRFETAYVYQSGNSYFESLQDITGARGWGNTIFYLNSDLYGIEPVPEMTNAALGIFGAIVVAAAHVRRRWAAKAREP